MPKPISSSIPIVRLEKAQEFYRNKNLAAAQHAVNSSFEEFNESITAQRSAPSKKGQSKSLAELDLTHAFIAGKAAVDEFLSKIDVAREQEKRRIGVPPQHHGMSGPPRPVNSASQGGSATATATDRRPYGTAMDPRRSGYYVNPYAYDCLEGKIEAPLSLTPRGNVGYGVKAKYMSPTPQGNLEHRGKAPKVPANSRGNLEGGSNVSYGPNPPSRWSSSVESGTTGSSPEDSRGDGGRGSMTPSSGYFAGRSTHSTFHPPAQPGTIDKGKGVDRRR